MGLRPRDTGTDQAVDRCVEDERAFPSGSAAPMSTDRRFRSLSTTKLFISPRLKPTDTDYS